VGGLALAVAVVATSWGSILARLCLSPAALVGFYRLLFATAILAPAALPGLRGGAASGRAVAAAAAAGILLALHFGTWIASLRLTGVAASTVLVSTQPVFSVLLSALFLGERPRRRTLVAIGLALAGVAVVAGGDLLGERSRVAGDLLALLGAVFAAGYLVVGRAARALAPLPAWLVLVNGSAAAAAGAAVLAGGISFRPPARADWVWLVLMAAVPHVLGHGALNWAVRRVRAYVANLAVLGEPVLASIYALLIFGEGPPAGVYAGAALVAAGVVLALREEGRGPSAAGAAGGPAPGEPR
jgi:drug/metabolite transporter (DMT)-like permease